jgi:hypothetical protein
MRDAEVEDQAPAASLVSQVVAELHVAAPLARACRDSLLGADRVSSRAEERAKGTIPSSCAPWLHLSELCTCLCGRRERPSCFLQPHLASRLLWWRGREESTGTPNRLLTEERLPERLVKAWSKASAHHCPQ